MTTPTNNKTTWPLGMSIRPAVDYESAKVEVADTLTGRRFHWLPDALATYILNGTDAGTELNGDRDGWREVLGSGADRAGLLPGWQHWEERGWHPSHQYYLASRQLKYADIEDPDGAIRARTMQKYLAAGGPPVDEVLPDGRRVALGTPMAPSDQKISHLLVSRRSVRAYTRSTVALNRLSGLLWYGLADVRARRQRIDESQPLSYLDSFGTAWDVYLCLYAVAGIAPGAYRYDILAHELIEVTPGDHRDTMVRILQGMRSPTSAAWTLGLVADIPRYQWRYRHEFGLRKLYLEAGVIGQELVVLGSSYRLGTLVTPAQQDSPYLELHGLSSDRYAPVYTLTMGPTRGEGGSHFGEGGYPTPVAS
jgi:hypothetical protein